MKISVTARMKLPPLGRTVVWISLHSHRRSLKLAAGAAVVLLLAAGCFGGGGGKTKAGGKSAQRITLTMETPDGPDVDAEYFIKRVKERTQGRIRIIESADPYVSADPANELRLVRALRSGKVNTAYLPTRAWERDGILSFRALQAPFLITSYELLRRITTGKVAREMLASLDRAGLVGLGQVPNELRRPLGRRPLVSAAAFRGARIRAPTSPTSELDLRTLGAVPVTNLTADEAGVALKTARLDGVESSMRAINDNGYQYPAPYLASNLALFAKTQTIVIRRAVFDRLSVEDRTAFREAAAAAVSHADPASSERVELKQLCDVGVRLVPATPADLSSLRRAAAPAYAVLERDPPTRPKIAAIERLKRAVPAGAATLPACRPHVLSAPGKAKTPFPQGTFITTVTAEDFARVGQPHVIPLPSTYTTSFRDGHWRRVANGPPDGGRTRPAATRSRS